MWTSIESAVAILIKDAKKSIVLFISNTTTTKKLMICYETPTRTQKLKKIQLIKRLVTWDVYLQDRKITTIYLPQNTSCYIVVKAFCLGLMGFPKFINQAIRTNKANNFFDW